MNTTITDKLVEEMKAVKLVHPSLEIQDILKLFQIQATRNLTIQLRRLVNGR